MTVNRDLDEDGVVEIDEEEEVAARRGGGPLRLILLILFAIVGLCVLCYLLSRLFGSSLPAIPGLSGLPGLSGGEPTATAISAETPPAVPTDPGTVPPTEPPATGETPPIVTEEPLPTSELTPIVTGEAPATTELPPVVTEEPPATLEPPGATDEPIVTATHDMVDEHGGELPTTEPTTPPSTPVQGPTITPTAGPPPPPPSGDCSANTPPTASATSDPEPVMMGKGEAIVTLDGSGSSDPDGTIDSYEWDFGDGSPAGSGETVTHRYGSTGSYEVTLMVMDNCGGMAETKIQVTVTGPTPPAPVTGTPPMTATGTITPTATVQPSPSATPDPNASAGTVGFCYRVRRGNTLTGIAYHFGVSLPVLAEVNGVSPAYYVIAGQGIFVPESEIQAGPNLYEVQAGDTLNSVAFHCGLSISRLAEANGLASDQSLSPGQFLSIPLWSWY